MASTSLPLLLLLAVAATSSPLTPAPFTTPPTAVRARAMESVPITETQQRRETSLTSPPRVTNTPDPTFARWLKHLKLSLPAIAKTVGLSSITLDPIVCSDLVLVRVPFHKPCLSLCTCNGGVECGVVCGYGVGMW